LNLHVSLAFSAGTRLRGPETGRIELASSLGGVFVGDRGREVFLQVAGPSAKWTSVMSPSSVATAVIRAMP
jgi:hypothetical protein